MEQIQPFLDFFTQHPGWALFFIFLIAFGEAILIIGLVVPSTVALVGAGMLVGLGKLGFWEVFLLTAVGAIAGDQVSYWAGRYWGDQLKLMWPLNRYPQLLMRGEDYVRQHGGKSIAIGRFVPGIKSVVPGIVGMLGMSQLYFLTVNVLSGLVWALLHVVPGILLGQGLSIAGELSERLVIVLVVFFALIAVTGWLIRLSAASLSPYIDTLLQGLSDSARTSKLKFVQRIGRALSPQRSSAKLIVLFSFIVLVGGLMFVDILTGLMLRGAISNLDLSTNNLLASLRSEPGDELMTLITMFGDRPVMLTIGAVMVAWLTFRRAWRPAIAAVIAIVVAYFSTSFFGLFMTSPRLPPGGLQTISGAFSFPSGHAVVAGTVLLMVALLVSQGRGRWTRALIISIFAGVAIAISFSQLYLGVHWVSDILGGLILAAMIVAVFGIVIEALPTRKIRPLAFAGVFAATLLATSFAYVLPNFSQQTALYAPVSNPVTLTLKEIEHQASPDLPASRITLAGQRKDPFVAVWVGDMEELKVQFATHGWQLTKPWSWHDSMSYLNTSVKLDDLAPQPLLHEGLPAKLTAKRAIEGNPEMRLVLRAYPSRAKVNQGGKLLSVYLLHLAEEEFHPQFYLINIPRILPANAGSMEQLRAELSSTAGVSLLAQGKLDITPPLFLAGQK